MIPPEFEYEAPYSLDDAIRLLTGEEAEPKLLAGGQSLLPLMKLRLASPTLLVDLRRIPGLRGIARTNGDFSIGPLTRHADVAANRELGVAAHVAALIGDQQVRNRGTIGGTLAHGDPAADMPTVLVATEGSVIARGRDGEREIAAADLFLGDLITALEPGEVITRVLLPSLDGYGFHYEKFTRRSEDWAIVGVVALVAVRDETCEDARVALTNMGPTPLRVPAVEKALLGKRLDRETIARAAQQAADDTAPPEDLNATVEYKRHLAAVLTRRALERAADNAGPSPQVRPARFRDRDRIAVASPGAPHAHATIDESGGMRIEQSFDIDAPLDRVWATFIDVESVAPCLPGAEITGSTNGVYQGDFRVKIGPASASYRGTVELDSVDEAAHTLVMKANGQDKRGQGSASATIIVALSEGDAGTHVDVTSVFTITGTLARFGRSGMIEDVANVLLQQFETCVEAKLSGRDAAPQAQALRGGRLFVSLLERRARRLLSDLRRRI